MADHEPEPALIGDPDQGRREELAGEQVARRYDLGAHPFLRGRNRIGLRAQVQQLGVGTGGGVDVLVGLSVDLGEAQL
ncbi:hypothetical protein GCM10027262_34420 [Nocardia tengchongensis]